MSPKSFLRRKLWRDRLTRLRAYKKIQFVSGEKPIFDFINRQAQETYRLDPNVFKNLVPEGYEKHAVLAFRQKLLSSTLDHDFAAGAMMMAAGIRTPFLGRLPRQWRAALARGGLRIHPASTFLWHYILLQKLREAVGQYLYLCRARPYEKRGKYAVLLGLPPGAYKGLAQENEKNYYNFVQWFRHHYPDENLDIVTGEDKTEGLVSYARFRAQIWPALENENKYKSFRRSGGKIFMRAIQALFSGNWHPLFLARDLIELNYITHINDDDLPVRTATTNSHYIYRPLWSYYLEARGRKAGLYFYSTNTFNMDLAEGSYGLIYGYNLMSWPDYFTATEEHKNFIESVALAKAHIHVVGPIPLEDNGEELPVKKKATIAYFDVQPFRDSFMSYIGRPSPLYFYEASRKNLEDLSNICRANNIDLALKPKREVGRRLCPRYARLIRQLEKEGLIKIIHSGISAERMCDWADAVVSQPFTSVAVSAMLKRKPSVYYDGAGLYKRDQPAAQKIEVLQSVSELEKWIRLNLKISEKVA